MRRERKGPANAPGALPSSGSVSRFPGRQLIVVYCRPEVLAEPGWKLTQFLRGIRDLPVPLSDKAIVISDNADLYGTLNDLEDRECQAADDGFGR